MNASVEMRRIRGQVLQQQGQVIRDGCRNSGSRPRESMIDPRLRPLRETCPEQELAPRGARGSRKQEHAARSPVRRAAGRHASLDSSAGMAAAAAIVSSMWLGTAEASPDDVL